jgi:hypothetical protein
MMQRIVVCFILAFVSACETPTAPQVAFREPFRLPINQSRFLEPDLTVTFSKLVSDGRCPDNPAIRCVWEGLAEIQLQIKQSSERANSGQAFDTVLNLKIPGFVSQDDSTRHTTSDTLGFRFTLLQLDPYPVLPDDPESEDAYSALLTINKSKPEGN